MSEQDVDIEVITRPPHAALTATHPLLLEHFSDKGDYLSWQENSPERKSSLYTRGLFPVLIQELPEELQEELKRQRLYTNDDGEIVNHDCILCAQSAERREQEREAVERLTRLKEGGRPNINALERGLRKMRRETGHDTGEPLVTMPGELARDTGIAGHVYVADSAPAGPPSEGE
jgi:hypothetical protein